MTQQWTKSPLSSKTHLTNSQRKAKSQSIDWLFFWSFTAIIRFAEQLRCGTLCLNGSSVHCVRPPQMQALEWASLVVGVARLELAASWSRTKRATKLRYTPTTKLIILCLLGFGKCFQSRGDCIAKRKTAMKIAVFCVLIVWIMLRGLLSQGLCLHRCRCI